MAMLPPMHEASAEVGSTAKDAAGSGRCVGDAGA
jgi:hypothetical protein